MINSIIKTTVFLACCSMAFSTVAQPADTVQTSVEKSTWGVQVGLIGAWAHHELRLADQVALRSEVGVSGQLYWKPEGSDGETLVTVSTPIIRIEPRWYYNLANRMRRSKNIAGNSGTFVSLPVTYIFGWATYNLDGKPRRIGAISIIPTWGIRRNIASHFTVEAGIGLGYLITTVKVPAPNGELVLSPPGNNIAAYTLIQAGYNLHVRIGYRFLGNASKKKNKY